MSNYDYDVKEIIGKGSFGDVFLAYKRGEFPRQPYVLKRVKLARQTPWQREATAREIELMRSLQHPFIVPFYETWTHNFHTVNVVLGYCEQGDLNTIMLKRKKPYEEPVLRRWMAQLLLALDYLEHVNVLHRDIKTGNIFLCKEGHVQLGDFGLASVKDGNDVNAEHDQSLVGTPHFMSPELLSQRGYNHQTDVWSLGCVMYELSAMRPAFNAFNLSGLIQKITRSNLPPFPSSFSQDWTNIVKSMLRKDPEQRPTVQQLLALPSLQHAVAEARRLARAMKPDVYLPPMAQSPNVSPSVSKVERTITPPEVDMDMQEAAPAPAPEPPAAAEHNQPHVPCTPQAGGGVRQAGRGLKRGGECSSAEEEGAAGGRGADAGGRGPAAGGVGGGGAGVGGEGGKDVGGNKLGTGARGRGRGAAPGGLRGRGAGAQDVSVTTGAGRGLRGRGAGVGGRGRGDTHRDQGPPAAGRGRRPSGTGGPATGEAAGRGAAAAATQRRNVRMPSKDSEGWGSGVKESAKEVLEPAGTHAQAEASAPPATAQQAVQPGAGAAADAAAPDGSSAPAAPAAAAAAAAAPDDSAGGADAAAGAQQAQENGSSAMEVDGGAAPAKPDLHATANGPTHAPAQAQPTARGRSSGTSLLLRDSNSKGQGAGRAGTRSRPPSRPSSRERPPSPSANTASVRGYANQHAAQHSILDRAGGEAGSSPRGAGTPKGSQESGGAGQRERRGSGGVLMQKRGSGGLQAKGGANGGEQSTQPRGRVSVDRGSPDMDAQQQARKQQQAARMAALREHQHHLQQEHQERLRKAREARGISSSPARRPPSPSGRGSPGARSYAGMRSSQDATQPPHAPDAAAAHAPAGAAGAAGTGTTLHAHSSAGAPALWSPGGSSTAMHPPAGPAGKHAHANGLPPSLHSRFSTDSQPVSAPQQGSPSGTPDGAGTDSAVQKQGPHHAQHTQPLADGPSALHMQPPLHTAEHAREQPMPPTVVPTQLPASAEHARTSAGGTSTGSMSGMEIDEDRGSPQCPSQEPHSSTQGAPAPTPTSAPSAGTPTTATPHTAGHTAHTAHTPEPSTTLTGLRQLRQSLSARKAARAAAGGEADAAGAPTADAAQSTAHPPAAAGAAPAQGTAASAATGSVTAGDEKGARVSSSMTPPPIKLQPHAGAQAGSEGAANNSVENGVAWEAGGGAIDSPFERQRAAAADHAAGAEDVHGGAGVNQQGAVQGGAYGEGGQAGGPMEADLLSLEDGDEVGQKGQSKGAEQEEAQQQAQQRLRWQQQQRQQQQQDGVQQQQQQQEVGQEQQQEEEGARTPVSRQSTALSLPTPTNSGLHLYGGREAEEEEEHQERQQLVRDTSGPEGLANGYDSNGYDSNGNPFASSANPFAEGDSSANNPFAGGVDSPFFTTSHINEVAEGMEEAPTANGTPFPGPTVDGPSARAGSINLGNFSQPQRLGSGDTSSTSSLSRGGWAQGADSEKRASSMEEEGPRAWTGNVMFQNAMFSDHSRQPSEPQLASLGGGEQGTTLPGGMGAEHARTPGPVQAFPLKGLSSTYHSQDEDDVDGAHRGLEDWSTPVHSRQDAMPSKAHPPSGLGSNDQAEKARLLQLEQAFQQARALLGAGKLEDLRMLLDGQAAEQEQ